MDSNPLGINNDSWDDLSKKEKKILETISNWDFTFLSGDQMIRHGIKDRQRHDSICLELKRFLSIKILRDPHPMGCFGPLIGAAWHAFILDTQRYEQFCTNTYGRTIHHKPSNYGKGVNDNTIWISIYKTWFGDFPEEWKIDLNGREINGYEYKMNMVGNVESMDMDSDDGAYP
ncbi:hypothetical protein [Vibrio natriegens]|uniref:hypothetical protein n=1 Tax=Vibrio natriegens TaxID=691 RepID=UPI000804366E|nr:hypothetical protein [Vibrio natriegens]ANQ17349.1 hypothetical protein BA891_08950 [Vibrio natriegens]